MTDGAAADHNYAIYINSSGTANSTGTWSNNTAITISLSGMNLWVGNYNFSLVATDGLGGSVMKWAWVNVTDDLPQFALLPSNITFIYGSTNNYLTWTVTDGAIISPTFAIFLNNSLNSTGTWVTGRPNTINLNSIPFWVGSYNLSIRVSDGISPLNVTCWVWVNVTDDSPVITGSPDLFYLTGSTGDCHLLDNHGWRIQHLLVKMDHFTELCHQQYRVRGQ